MLANFQSALKSIWGNKVRSLLTLLGVVIGVTSVTTLIAMGQGLQNDVSGLIRGFGTNVIVVVGGNLEAAQSGGQINPASLISGDIITEKDLATIQQVPGVETLSPLSLVAGQLKLGNKVAAGTVFGAYPTIVKAFQTFSLEEGSVFSSNAAVKQIVIGHQVKQQLFGDSPALGRKITLTGEEYEVIGVLSRPKQASVISSEYDTLCIIPFDQATVLNRNQVKIMRVIVKANDGADVNTVKKDVSAALLTNHNGENDFTVMTQDDMLSLFSSFLNLATTLVSAIAAISLLVGGIGIMNIMLVTVTERTREIGLRKAVGATNWAIMWQFLVEAVIITLVGGAIGLAISFGVGAIVVMKTELTPQFTSTVIGLALGIAVFVGAIFGLWPALRAAKKDPIEALRYE